MKKHIAYMLTLLLAGSLLFASGCQIAEIPEDAVITPALQEDGAGAVQSAPSGLDDAVFATVGERTIPMRKYEMLFETYMSYYSMFGMNVSEDPSMLAEFQTMVRDVLLEEEIIRYQAEKNGVAALSAEQEKEVQAMAEDTINAMKEQFTQMAEEAKASDDTIDVETYVANLIADEAEYNTGTPMNEEEYMAWLKEEASIEALRENLIALLCQDVTVSAEEVENWYTQALSEDEAYYTENPASFKSAEESFLCSGAEEGYLPVVYVPEGYSRVMDILVTPKADVHELYPDYAQKTADMEDLKSEYGVLAFEDAVAGQAANEARLSQIVSEYNTLREETGAMEAEAGRDALASIEEAYAKLEEGANFESVQLHYTENEMLTTCETLMSQGLLIHPGANDGSWSEACVEAFQALEPGAYSPVIKDEEGYHILYNCGAVEAGARPLEAVSAQIEASLLEDARHAAWNDILAAWRADESVVVNEAYLEVGAAA